MKRRNKRGRKGLVCLLVIAMLFGTGSGSLLASNMAYAVDVDDPDTVDHEVNLSFTPRESTVPIGNEGAFSLEAQVAGVASAQSPVEIKIPLPVGIEDYIQGFVAVDSDVAGEKHFVNGNNSSIRLIVPENGAPYLFLSLKNGEHINSQISFKVPEGTGEALKIEVSDAAIDVKRQAPDAISGNVIKKGGALSFIGNYEWNPVVKTTDMDTVATKGTDSLARDITYTVSAERKSVLLVNGDLYTKAVTLTDTLTLPENVKFTEGDRIKVDEVASTSNNNLKIFRFYIVNGTEETLVATLNQVNGAANVNTRIANPTITRASDGSNSGDTISFDYIHEATYTDETVANYTSEIIYPKYTMTLHKDKAFDIVNDNLADSAVIENAVTLNAKAWNGTDAQPSTASVQTALSKTPGNFTISKNGSAYYPDDTGDMYIRYEVIIRNWGDIALDKVSVTDPVPEGLEIITNELPAGVTQTGNTLSWDVTNLGVGGRDTKTFVAKVDATKISAGERIVNTATGTYGTITKQDSATNTYKSGLPNLAINKTAYTDGVLANANIGVAEGGDVSYRIVLENLSGKDEIINFEDIVPEYIEGVSVRIGSNQSSGINASHFNVATNVDGKTTVSLTNRTLRSGGRIEFFIDGTVKAGTYDELTSPLKVITNKATVTDSLGGSKESSATIVVRDRTPVIQVAKNKTLKEDGTVDIENVQADSTLPDIYKLNYTVKLTNTGDIYYVGDGETITDVMTGGLQPGADIDPNATIGTTGTISASATLADGSTATITGNWTKQANTTTGETEYLITYEIPSDIPKGASISINYDAYVNMANLSGTDLRTHAFSNNVSAFGITATDSLTLMPIIEADKKIVAINGAEIEPATTSPVQAKDSITYELVIKNTGARDTLVDIKDTLPSLNTGSSFEWVNHIKSIEITEGSNITADGYALVSSNLASTMTWSDVKIEAGETIKIRITLEYGDTSTEFDQAFKTVGPNTIFNTLTVTYKDTITETDGNNAKEWVSRVSHNVNPANPDIDKTNNHPSAYQGGEEAVFTLSGFDTNIPADGFKVTDNLINTVNTLDITAIHTGSYTASLLPSAPETARDTYTLNVTVKNGDTETKKEITNVPLDGRAITVQELSLMEGDQIVSVEWDFGDLDSLAIVNAPKIIGTIKAGVTKTGVQNIAHVSWNGSQTKSKEITYDVVPEDTLTKNASMNGIDLGDNYNVAQGDEILYTIQYTNNRNTPLALSGVTFVDHMTTAGLATGSYDVTYSMTNPGDSAPTTTTASGAIEITDEDIASSTAKKVELKAPNDWQLGDGETIQITYTITMGELANSYYEYKSGQYEDWGLAEDGSLSDTPANMGLVHNRVTVTIENQTLMADTGYYYKAGDNKLMIQKSVLGLGVSRNDSSKTVANYGIYRETVSDKTIFELDLPETFSYFKSAFYYAGNITSGPQSAMTEKGDRSDSIDLSIWGDKRYFNVPNQSSSIYYDTIRYGLIIANDSDSSEAFSVKKIIDSLPENAVVSFSVYETSGDYNINSSFNSGGVLIPQSGTGNSVTGNVYSGVPQTNSFYEAQSEADIQAKGYAQGSYRNATSADVLSTMANMATAPSSATNVTTRYDHIFNTLNTGDNTENIYITKNTSTAIESLTLAPGEYISIVYFTQINRSSGDPASWDNTVTMEISPTEGKTDFDQPFTLMDTETSEQYKLRLSQENTDKGVTRNDGTINQSGENTFSSTVSIYPSKGSLGIEKQATAKILGSWNEQTKISDLSSGERNLASSIDFSDAVEWTVTLSNGSPFNLSGYSLEDEIPYPYEVITDTDETGKTIVGETLSGEKVYGSVTNALNATFGGTGQTITFDTSENGALDLGASSNENIKIYTRYAGSALMSLNYYNTVTVKAPNINDLTITSGTPVRDTVTTIGTMTDAAVRPTSATSASSYKSITFGNSTANGNELNNTVSAEYVGDKVLYTLTVTNASSSNYTDIVLIDRLPAINDIGVVNAQMTRGSEFDVKLTEDLDGTYLKNPGVAEYQKVNTRSESSPGLQDDGWIGFDSNNLKVTKELYPGGFDSDSWVTNALHSNWDSYRSAQQNDYTAVRFSIGDLNAGEQVVVRFVASIGENADPGEVAYNTFGYSFTTDNNRYYAEPEKVGVEVENTSFSGTKVWNDGGNVANRVTPTLRLYSQVAGEEKQLVDTANPVWTNVDTDIWTFTYTGLRATMDGQPVTYSVEEETLTGYTGIITTNQDGTVTITNTLLTSLTGNKTWLDNSDAYNTRPDSITLNLYQTIDGTRQLISNATPTWTKNTDNTWTYEYTGLPAYTPGGNAIAYSVEEEPVAGYTGVRTNNDITNTLTEKISIPVTKYWIDAGHTNHIPNSVTVGLYADGVLVRNATLTSAGTGSTDQPLDVYAPWSVTFVNLDKYDSQGKQITYTVTENLTGDDWHSVVEAAGTGFTITNTYTKYVALDLEATKTLTGISHANTRTFTFEIYAVSGTTETLLREVNNAEGAIDLGTFEYDAEGTYIYKVVEKQGTNQGMTYDSSAYYIKVDVTADADGFLAASAQYAKATGTTQPADSEYLAYNSANVVFNNSYSALGTANIDAAKTLTGRNLADGEFSFVLTGQGTAPMPTGATGNTKTVTNDVSGAVDFGDISYTSPGTYYYILTESAGSLGGVTYDTKQYDIRVTVTDESYNGALTTAVSYAVHDSTKDLEAQNYADYTAANQLIFENTYTVGEIGHQFTVTKHMAGRTFRTGDTFTFRLTGSDITSPIEISTAATGGTSQTLRFQEITYTSAGTYNYTITEVNTGITGIEYDGATYSATVVVSDAGNGAFTKAVTYTKTTGQTTTASAEYTDSSIEFTNNYYEPTDVALRVNKALVISGTTTPVTLLAGEYTFNLTGQGNAPMPAGQVGSIITATNGNGISPDPSDVSLAVFQSIIFTEEGTYTYTITEVAGNKSEITYSSEEITATVTVNKNNVHGLVASVVYSKASETDSNAPKTITNSYTLPDPISLSLGATKTLTGRDLADGEFSFTLTGQAGAPMPADATGNTKTVTNDGNGRIDFGEITYGAGNDVNFSQATYTYVISETQGRDPDVTYDSHDVTVTVKITKNADNTLSREVTYSKDGQNVSSAEFNNTFSQNGSTKIALSAFKTLKGRSLEAGEFTFLLKDQEGKTIETVTNLANGDIIFTPIEYTDEGNHTYTIEEVKSGDLDVVYDETVAKAEVTVTKGPDNKLTSSVKYLADGETIERPVFENKIKNDEPKTGDERPLRQSAAAMIISGITAWMIYGRSRKEEKTAE